MNRPQNLLWKAEVEFQGSPEEFSKIAELINNTSLKVKLWPRPFPFPGGWPVDWRVVLGEVRAKEFLVDTREVKIRYIKDIAGGIRDPHLHIGDQIALIDRARFKDVLVEVTRELAARRVETMDDYLDVMAGINPMTEG